MEKRIYKIEREFNEIYEKEYKRKRKNLCRKINLLPLINNNNNTI